MTKEQIGFHLKDLFFEIKEIQNTSEYWSLIDLILKQIDVRFWDEDHCSMKKDSFSLENAKYIYCSSKDEAYFIFKVYESMSYITEGFDFKHPESGDWAYSEKANKWFLL